jgi:hypothetical protein
MSMEGLSGNAGNGKDGDVGEVPDIGDEGLFAGTKIDSEEEALASPMTVETDAVIADTVVADTQGALYTLGMWRVKEGQQADFIAAWQALGDIFRQLPQPPAGKGRLVQSLSDPTLFYSFGPWLTRADMEAMRQDALAQAGLENLRQYCTESQSGAYRTVAEAEIETDE